ncbi:MAG: RNA 2'-phosphotransferase [Thermoplasmatota archaeon]
MDPVAVSKHLSYLLRHHPDGLDMDPRGYVPVGQIIERLRRRFPGMDRKQLQRVMESSGRQRFEILGNHVRARYGHSIPVDIDWPTADDVAVLYHGTTEQAAEQIIREGLRPRGRQMVHLSATPREARRVGRRHGPPVVLYVDAAAARRRDVTFYRATELVYLAIRVPASCISRMD